MSTRVFVLTATALLSIATAAAALDQIQRTEGPPTGGKILEMTPLKVVYDQNGVNRELEVNRIQSIQYDGENPGMKTLRKHILDGRYEEALGVAEKLEGVAAARKEITADVQFYKALATARLALAGTGTVSAAGKLMLAFVKANPNNYHFLEAAETLGQLGAIAGNYPFAIEYYSKVAETPWPDYKMRAGVAIGNCLLAQQKFEEAAKAFKDVLAIQARGDAAYEARTAATLGSIRCQLQTAKPEEAIAQAEKVIAETNPEKKEVMALAYNVLGSALRKAQRNKEAILAFLHVDLLYSSLPEAHAEALANLCDLWSATQQPERAARCRRVLEDRYPNSVWARKG